jgi:enoyl-CoA hydratase / 3-hydroxyacyl-CoA dehydrogenase
MPLTDTTLEVTNLFVFKAAVVGAGTMGGEIAQAIASSDIPVVLKDIEQKFVDHGLEKAREVTKGQLDRLVSKEKLTQEQADARLEEVMGLITGAIDYSGFGDVDFVIEAAPERMEIKQKVFRELDEVTPGRAILASNTSSLSVTEMGEATLRSDKVIGFHFFYPASVMPLVEIVEGEDASEETVAAAINFAQAIRKQPITCAEVPGFVVNRILNSAVGEVWRAQEEQGLSIKKIDEAVTAANVAPMGPFVLGDLLGLDTILHVAEHLNEAYGSSFYVHEGMKKLVEDGKLGAKSGGEGFYKDGEPQLPGDAEPDGEALAELMSLKALVEACLLLDEGVCSARELDLGMMAGAGMDPRRGIFPPLMKVDMTGLDEALEKLERAKDEHGERFDPPVILRRLVAQGRLGQKSGQGFYPYPQPDEGEQPETVKLETRDYLAVAWLANPPMNAISPQVIKDLRVVWDRVKEADGLGAMVICSSNPLVFSAGADIKAFTQMDEAGGRELIDGGHALLRELGQSRVSTVAAVNSIAFGGGCELAMACDFRIAAESAIFGQPEIKLGLIPGFGGTQRLPRLVGTAKGLEMNLIGDAITASEASEFGLANRVVPDHELFETALAWGRKLAGQAPVAVEQAKLVSDQGDLDEGIDAEKAGFAAAFQSEDAKEGISAFLAKRTARWKGK